MRIAIVCHGNIARSQVLHRFLVRALAVRNVPGEVFSCGTATREAYANEDELLAEVRRELGRRGLAAEVARTCWGPQTAKIVGEADVVLVADGARRADVLQRTGIDPSRVHLFYEFIGEGVRDFTDTFDPSTGRQDPQRFARCFDELERIAERVAHRICCTGTD